MTCSAATSAMRILSILAATLIGTLQVALLFGQNEPFLWRGVDGEPIPFEDSAAIEDFLQTARVVEVKGIDKGVTNPRKLLLEKNGIHMHAIFRSVDLFKAIWRTSEGIKLDYRDSCRYEFAAYKLSKLLEIERVPPVVRRTFRPEDFENGRDYERLGGTPEGTVEAWVEGAMTEMERRKNGQLPPDTLQWAAEYQRMYLFDSLTFNDDRNLGNILIGPEWKIWLIDSTRSFRPYRELREPEKIKRCDARVWARLLQLTPETLRRELGDILEPKVLDCLISRHQALVEHIRGLLDKRGEKVVLLGPRP